MILSTSMSQPTVPKLLDPPPGMMTSDFGASFPRSPLDEADQMCSMFMNDYSAPESPGSILGLIDDIRMDCPNKDIWKLLPTPPRSPDHCHYGCSKHRPHTAAVPIDSGSSAMVGSTGALGQAWAGLCLDEWSGPLEDPPEVPSVEEQEAICAILFEHDDFIDRLLKDDSVLDSVLGGSSGSGEIADVDTMAAVEDWSSPTSPTQPAVKSELLHDCMWSGQCTDDCKQKAAREKRQALVATPTSSFDVVVSPESAMPTPDVLVANPLFASSSSRFVVGATSCRTSMVDDESVATQCVDPSSVLGYTPLSDHSYHQATTSAPPTPPDSPRAVTQQGSSSASGAGAGSGSTSSPPLLVVRRRNGIWKREVVVSDTPSESDEDDDDDDDEDEEADDEPQMVEEQQQPEDDDDEDDDDDDDDEDDEEIDVVTVSGERHHGGRHGAAAPAVVALPANGSVNAIRCAGRLPRVIVGGVSSAPASPAVVSRMTSSGRVVTPSHKALTNGQTQRRRRRRGTELATSPSAVASGKRKRPRHHHHHHHHHGSAPSSPQSKRLRRDEDSLSSSSSLSSQSSSRRGGHHSLSQLPPSAKRNEHNTMERKRRDDLRVAFQELREKVPSLADNKKAAKVTILNEAAHYAKQLSKDFDRYDILKQAEETRRETLKRRLALLHQQQRARHPYRR